MSSETVRCGTDDLCDVPGSLCRRCDGVDSASDVHVVSRSIYEECRDFVFMDVQVGSTSVSDVYILDGADSPFSGLDMILHWSAMIEGAKAAEVVG